jgi:exopolysaccharide production protein ExoY
MRNYMYDILKRIMDVLGSCVALVFFSPLLLATALWIKMISPEGPIFADIPPRVGKNKQPFRFYKFRSMIPNAHEALKKDETLYKKYVANNYKLSANEDPRIIKGGTFIRKYSLDEFPQFINVLKGDMSIVGPRAYYFFEVEEQCARFPATKKYIDALLKVKPGITGVWQVGGRSNVPFEERVKMDAIYAEKRSILYDLLLILKTPYIVLTKKGAL